ncbi:hypothetical protein HDA44_003104 [Kribbella solani]|uniref:Uncharacterized protein n=1 Tax=Kribbella solani TaxID=236067 RepID=A0A841DM76_9ACTN|nr:hypothetical protein [Kribbella solani]
MREAAAALPHGTTAGHDGTFHTLPPETLAAALKDYFVTS